MPAAEMSYCVVFVNAVGSSSINDGGNCSLINVFCRSVLLHKCRDTKHHFCKPVQHSPH